MEVITDNTLYWAKVRENAIIPTKADENAGYDIYACFDEDYICLNPNETKLIPTGIACAVSEDYYLQVQERGSTGSKGIKYGAGVIDSGYRGEIFIAITNANSVPLCICKDMDAVIVEVYPYVRSVRYPAEKAIAQLIVHDVPKMNPQEISYDELKTIPSERGDGLLGSTDK